MKNLYVCEDTITGIYSAIYDAWKENRKEGSNGIRLLGQFEGELFCEYHIVEETERKALAVENLIRKHLGLYAYRSIYYALLSSDSERADAVLGMMQAARELKDPTKIMHHLSHPKVEKVFELSRSVSNEAHFYIEVVRFRELANGILFSEIAPKHQILTCIGEHFSDRFPLENWMIYDRTHGLYLVHEAGKNWFLMQGFDLNPEATHALSENESDYARLWKSFCKTISIEERKNLKCQRNHLPLRYREHMVEFQ